ncbi:tRNA-splicing endonuclease subunit sen54 [Mortierella sp. AD011]|nr:tRNA-splicing endonuclease subunit sen54 [Mortierella sp. AD010]KAF9397865.1 tRNA-splicing endonuclease subunit sen54 [Mortierella sp. AD011]
MDAADQDDNDQHPDFRLLLSNSKGQSSSQALPSRDTKSAQDPAAVLEEQYNAYFQILAEERHAAERTFSRAVYEPDLGLFRLTVNRGTHFVSMGHTLHGQIYLYPEEALYLVDRGSLLVEHRGTNMTVQQMWNIYLSLPHQRKSQSKGDDQNPTEKDGSSVMDRYLTYAYLKRLGFVVIRPGTYCHESESRTQPPTTVQNQLLTRPLSYLTFLWSAVKNSMFAAWRRHISCIGLGLGNIANIWARPSNRPLVSNRDHLRYDQILDRLQIIPTVRLAQSRYSDTCVAPNSESDIKEAGVVDFDVYKPAGAFKKRQPGIPDYQVVVVRPADALPTVNQLKALMAGQLDPAQETTSPLGISVAPEKGKKKKTIDWPKILFAVVSGGQVSFMTIYNVKATP